MPWGKCSPPPDLSLIIPFHDFEEDRTNVFQWLLAFWGFHLPDAQIIIADYDSLPFSKAIAVNRAARLARGRIFAIVDADCYMDPAVIEGAAHQIIQALDECRRLWIVPYSHLYRLNFCATEQILRGDPQVPYDFPSPPPLDDLECPPGNEGYGHRYGAMIMIMPQEAFWLVRGFDERFLFWGGEDSSLLRALDTLYCQHENTPNDVLHLWHRRIGPLDDHSKRQWVGQKTGNAGARLSQRYERASADLTFMRALIDERP